MSGADQVTPGEGARLEQRLVTLLERSMVAWRLLARVARAADGAIVVAGLGREVHVTRAAPDAPFRWMVSVDGRKRPAVSVVAVLRQVRQALDPGYATSRIRVAPMPLLPPGAD